MGVTTKGNVMAESFSKEERAAMKARAKELKEQSTKADGLAAVLAAISEMTGDERATANRIHEIVGEAAPELDPKTYYGMPGWARDGKVLVFFQSATKFKTRYSTLGFNDNAAVDEGSMWPVAYAITKLTAAHEKTIAALITKAVGR
jgi:uncharacterized protein YdhG (YjbR/CyaY superfamily)